MAPWLTARLKSGMAESPKIFLQRFAPRRQPQGTGEDPKRFLRMLRERELAAAQQQLLNNRPQARPWNGEGEANER